MQLRFSEISLIIKSYLKVNDSRVYLMKMVEIINGIRKMMNRFIDHSISDERATLLSKKEKEIS